MATDLWNRARGAEMRGRGGWLGGRGEGKALEGRKRLFIEHKVIARYRWEQRARRGRRRRNIARCRATRGAEGPENEAAGSWR